MKKALATVSIAFVLAACSGGETSSGGGSSGQVIFSLDPATGPQCTNADDSSSFEGSFSRSITCRWHCATYKGQSKRWVSLRFRRRKEAGAQWELVNEFVSSGVCS